MEHDERRPIFLGSDENIKTYEDKDKEQNIEQLYETDEPPLDPTSLCDPRNRSYRFIGLFFMCLVGFGPFFCYDNPSALQQVFKEQLNLSATDFTLLYSIYSWPNVIFCFIGGYLLDHQFGIRVGTLIYLVIVLIGQLTFAFGGLMNKFWLMITGRFIFGIGAESLAVAQNNYAVLWFNGKELNMVFGLQISVSRLGSTVNFWIMQPFYEFITKYYPEKRAVGVLLLAATSTCAMSLLCAVILAVMDKRVERVTKRITHPSGNVGKLTDVLNFPYNFWLLSVICVAYYVAVFPFIALGQSFFVEKFNLTIEAANSINGVVYLISALAAPFLGTIVDKTGRNLNWVFLAIISTIMSHILLSFTMLNPLIATSIMGLAYSMLAASLWPIVALLVPSYQLGTAYGYCQSVQNLGLALVSVVSGMIVDANNGKHFWVEIFFIAWLIVALLATISMWLHDKQKKTNLNMTPLEREKYASNILKPNIAALITKFYARLLEPGSSAK